MVIKIGEKRSSLSPRSHAYEKRSSHLYHEKVDFVYFRYTIFLEVTIKDDPAKLFRNPDRYETYDSVPGLYERLCEIVKK